MNQEQRDKAASKGDADLEALRQARDKKKNKAAEVGGRECQSQAEESVASRGSPMEKSSVKANEKPVVSKKAPESGNKGNYDSLEIYFTCIIYVLLLQYLFILQLLACILFISFQFSLNFQLIW